MVQPGYFSSVELACDHENYFLEYLDSLEFSINSELLCDFSSFSQLKGRYVCGFSGQVSHRYNI